MSALASGVWNGRVTGDVTWPWKVKVVSQIYLDANSLKTIEDKRLGNWYQWVTNRKGRMANWLVTWTMTSRDGHVTDDVTWLRKVKSWPQYVCGTLSRQWLEIETQLQWSTYRKLLPRVSNGHVTGDVTYPEGQGHCPDIFRSIQISRKRLRPRS